MKYVCADFHENNTSPITFVKDSDSEFHKTPTDDLTTGATSHTDTQSGRPAWSHYNFVLNFVKNTKSKLQMQLTLSHKRLD